MTYSADEVLGEIDTLLATLQQIETDVGEPAFVFTTSVKQSAESMRQWIQDNEHVTDKQARAVRNWQRGAEKWLNAQRLV